MRFKSLLKEVIYLKEDRSEPINLNHAVEIFKEASPSYSEDDFGNVFRGKSGADRFLYVDPSRFTRKSENADNHYTLWIDNRWPAKFPKRSKSIICSSSKNSAEKFGNLYVVLPLSDAKFGVVPNQDIWQSFKPFIRDRYNTSLPKFFVGVLSHFLQQATQRNKKYISDDSFSALMDDLAILQSLSDQEWKRFGTIGEEEADIRLSNEEGWKKFSKDVIQNNGNLVSFLQNKVLNPEVNNFEVNKFSELDQYDDNEVWTSTECLMIKSGRTMGDFRSKL